MFTLVGKEMTGPSSFTGRLCKYLDSIGNSDLLKFPEQDAIGGNNNAGGILPVMPPKSEYYTGKDYGPNQGTAYAAVTPHPGRT